MFRIICILLGYCIGLIQTAYIVGKATAKIDIRDHGSGNAGTTNTVRVLGFKAGFTVFVCDIIKAIIGFVVCSLIFNGSGTFFPGGESILPGLYGSFGVILGHNFPFYLKFKGGKGSASFLGMVLCIHFPMCLIIYIAGVIIVATTRYISAASLAMTLMLPFVMYFFGFPLEASVITFTVACLSWYLHRGNIKRLLKGTESKFNFKKQL